MSKTIEMLIEKLADQYPNSDHMMTVENFAYWLQKNALAVERQEQAVGCSKCNKGFVCIDWEAGQWGDCPDCKSTKTSPPAPVAVVLPDSDDFIRTVNDLYGSSLTQLCLLDGNDLEMIWNACLGKVKEMNP